MSYQESRYNDYLGNYHFFPNSIEFRIVSSKALEKWKNVQSFQLNQLINGKFFFDQDRRELLLLKYDMWSRWLVELENLFIELHEDTSIVRQKDLDVVIKLAKKTAEKYTTIIRDEHTHHFKDDFSEIWLETHNVAYEIMIEEIRKLHGTYEGVFSEIVHLLCNIMQYTLTEIHELNEIFKDPEASEIFLVISNFCAHYAKTGNCVVSKRLKIYSKYFPFKSIWFKNYTHDRLPTVLMNNVEASGFEVNYKKTLFK